VPDQVPGSAVSVPPCTGVPAIVGGLVFAGGWTDSMISWGALDAPASRLASVVTFLLGVVRARLTRPLPLTSGVTSSETHAPDETVPDVAATAPAPGAFAYVIAFSCQPLSATPRTSKPVLDAVVV